MGILGTLFTVFLIGFMLIAKCTAVQAFFYAIFLTIVVTLIWASIKAHKEYKEQADLNKLVDALGGQEEIDRIWEEYLRQKESEENQQQGQSIQQEDVDKDPCQVLGISEGITFKEIKAAYNKKVLENHPDRTAGLGEEYRQLAEKRMREINMAYDKLTKNKH